MSGALVIHIGPEGPVEDAVAAMFRANNHPVALHEGGGLAESLFYAMGRGSVPFADWSDARLIGGLFRHAPHWRPPLEGWRCAAFLRRALPDAYLLLSRPHPDWALWRAGQGAALAAWRHQTGLPDAALPGLWDEDLAAHLDRVETDLAGDPRLIRLDPARDSPADLAHRLRAVLPLPDLPFRDWPAPASPAMGAGALIARPLPAAAAPGWTEDVARFCLRGLDPKAGGSAAGLSPHACHWNGAYRLEGPKGAPRQCAFPGLPGNGPAALMRTGRHFKLIRAEGVVNDILRLDRRDPVWIDMEDSRWFGSPQGEALDRPVLCHNRRAGAVNAVLWPLPDQHSIGLPGFDPAAPADDIAFDDKQDRLVWRGMISGSEMTGAVKPGAASHVLLSQLADPARRDAAWARLCNTNRLSFIRRFIGHPDFDIGAVLAWGFRQFAGDPALKPYLRPRLSVRDFRRFRYRLCMTGYDHGSNFIEALDSHSVLLAEDDGWEVFYSGRFRPWEHYIPVARYLPDIEEKLAWARAHPARCRAMSRAARAEAANLRDPDARRDLMRLILDGIAAAR